VNFRDKNWLEWVVFAVSLVIVVGTTGYLAYDGVTAEDAPPTIAIQFGEPLQQVEQFTVPVTVISKGGGTAERVRIEAVLERRGTENEHASFEIALLPRGGTREGSVVFRSDPRAGELKARVLGYERP
jgi:uncharacterized protein (TIGR02588 family)